MKLHHSKRKTLGKRRVSWTGILWLLRIDISPSTCCPRRLPLCCKTEKTVEGSNHAWYSKTSWVYKALGGFQSQVFCSTGCWRCWGSLKVLWLASESSESFQNLDHQTNCLRCKDCAKQEGWRFLVEHPATRSPTSPMLRGLLASQTSRLRCGWSCCRKRIEISDRLTTQTTRESILVFCFVINLRPVKETKQFVWVRKKEMCAPAQRKVPTNLYQLTSI